MGTDTLLRPPPTTSRTFWTYWSAGTVGSLGSAVTSVALPLTAVVVLHATTFEVGLLTAATYAAWLLVGLPAGVLVGRLPLRGTQLAMDLVRAAAVMSVPVAWWAGLLTLWQLVVVALVVSIASVFFEIGNMTFLPALVPAEELTARNSLMSGTHATVQLAGPSLGGVLVQLLGAVPALVTDAVSYVVSAVLLRRLPERTVPAPERRASMWTDIREGWHFVVRHPVMGPCMWEATAVNFACGALMALTPVYLVRELGASPGLVGVLMAAEGLGTLAGAALAPRIGRRWGSARTTLVTSALGSVTALLIPLGDGAAGMVWFALGTIGFAAGVVVGSITTRTLRQRVTPSELLSRVMATVRFVSWGAIPVGSLAAGALGSVIGIRGALWCTCVATFLPVAILWASPVRRIRDLEDVPAVG